MTLNPDKTLSLTKTALRNMSPCNPRLHLSRFPVGRDVMTASEALKAGTSVSDLLWVAGKMGLKESCVRFALLCAQRTAYLNPDPRVQAALDATQAWLDAPSEKAEAADAARAAARAAWAAARAAARAAWAAAKAADVAEAAAKAAAWAAWAAAKAAADAAWAAKTAADAAWAAAADAAWAAADAADAAADAADAAADAADVAADAADVAEAAETQAQKKIFIKVFCS